MATMDPDFDEDADEEKVEGFETFLQEALKCIIVVDGLPKVKEEKQEKLTKHLSAHPTLLKTWGSTPKSVTMPILEGSTQGFAFLEFDTSDLAARARKNGNNYKLDKAHTLLTNQMEDFERIIKTEAKYVEPPTEEYKEQENMKAWLMDEQARDQFVVRFDEETQVRHRPGGATHFFLLPIPPK